RAAVADRLLEHLADRRYEPSERGTGDFARGLARIDPRAEQRLADVYVAEPGDDPLVQKHQLDRRLPVLQRGAQVLDRQVRSERLRAHRGECRPLIERRGVDEIDETEPARVVK